MSIQELKDIAEVATIAGGDGMTPEEARQACIGALLQGAGFGEATSFLGAMFNFDNPTAAARAFTLGQVLTLVGGAVIIRTNPACQAVVAAGEAQGQSDGINWDLLEQDFQQIEEDGFFNTTFDQNLDFGEVPLAVLLASTNADYIASTIFTAPIGAHGDVYQPGTYYPSNSWVNPYTGIVESHPVAVPGDVGYYGVPVDNWTGWLYDTWGWPGMGSHECGTFLPGAYTYDPATVGVSPEVSAQIYQALATIAVEKFASGAELTGEEMLLMSNYLVWLAQDLVVSAGLTVAPDLPPAPNDPSPTEAPPSDPPPSDPYQGDCTGGYTGWCP